MAIAPAPSRETSADHVIGDDGDLLGTLTAAELLALPDDTALGAVVHRDQPRIRSDADQEKMASIALHHKVAAMPVVDEAGHLVGVVGSTALMDIARREHVDCQSSNSASNTSPRSPCAWAIVQHQSTTCPFGPQEVAQALAEQLIVFE